MGEIETELFAKNKEKGARIPGFCFGEKTCPEPIESLSK